MCTFALSERIGLLSNRMVERQLKTTVRIFTDCLCLVIVCLPTIILTYDTSIPTFRRGWYCDDESIKKPNLQSTVHWPQAIIAAVLLPTVLVAVIELIHYVYNPARTLLPKFHLGNITISNYLWILYRFLGVFYFGMAICMSFKDIGKVTIGRLRPHFITVCKPDWNKVNCSRYVENDVCTGDPVDILEARKSFPSGHSAISFYSAVYAAMYVQYRMTWTSCVILRHALQTVLLWMAWFTALSRISDYKHHWSDVLSGTVLGVVSAVLVVLYVGERFRLPGDDTGATSDTRLQTMETPSRKISNSSRESRKISRTSTRDKPDHHASTELDRPSDKYI